MLLLYIQKKGKHTSNAKNKDVNYVNNISTALTWFILITLLRKTIQKIFFFNLISFLSTCNCGAFNCFRMFKIKSKNVIILLEAPSVYSMVSL